MKKALYFTAGVIAGGYVVNKFYLKVLTSKIGKEIIVKGLAEVMIDNSNDCKHRCRFDEMEDDGK